MKSFHFHAFVFDLISIRETKEDRDLRKWTQQNEHTHTHAKTNQTNKQNTTGGVVAKIFSPRSKTQTSLQTPRARVVDVPVLAFPETLVVLSSEARWARLILLWFYGWPSQFNQQCCGHCGNNKPQQTQGEVLTAQMGSGSQRPACVRRLFQKAHSSREFPCKSVPGMHEGEEFMGFYLLFSGLVSSLNSLSLKSLRQ